MIGKIIEGKITPIIHRYFTRFGMGDFEGPTLTANTRGNIINIKGSFEFFGDIIRLFLSVIPYDVIQVNGVVKTFSAFNEEANKLLAPWKIKTDTKFDLSISKTALLNLFAAVEEKAFVFGKFSGTTLSGEEGVYRIESKLGIPEPDKYDTEVAFFKGRFENSDEVKLKLRALLWPFAEKMTRTAEIKTQIFIEKLHDPNPTENEPLRLRAIRNGYLDYVVTIDGKEIHKKIPFSI